MRFGLLICKFRKMKYAYYNGEIIEKENIIISHQDLGFQRGYGIMDAMKTVNGVPFLMKEHFERLEEGLGALNLQVSINLQRFKEIVDELLVKNNCNRDVAIKTVVTGGKSSNGFDMDGKPTVLITLNSLANVTPNKQLYKAGAKTISVEFQRQLPTVKTTNYITALQHQRTKNKNRALDILYYNKGIVLEGSTSNVFIIKEDKIITPAKNILLGVTRNFVIKLFKESNIIVEERKIKLEELLQVDEVFLTGTFKDILPITQVDDIIIGGGNVGERTKQGMELLKSAMN